MGAPGVSPLACRCGGGVGRAGMGEPGTALGGGGAAGADGCAGVWWAEGPGATRCVGTWAMREGGCGVAGDAVNGAGREGRSSGGRGP
jgi:hypothetical protein